MKLSDLTNRRIGFLTVKGRAGTNTCGKPLWNAVCDCGTDVVRATPDLKSEVASCGCQKAINRRLDLTSQAYGSLHVISKASKGKWNCICACGAEHVASTSDLRSGHTKSCGCLKKKIWVGRQHPSAGKASVLRKNHTGEKHGKLTFLVDTGKSIGNRSIWKLACDCGKTIELAAKPVLSGNTKSCGCAKTDWGKNKPRELYEKVASTLRKKSAIHIGKQFGKLTITSIDYGTSGVHNVALAVCACDCGNSFKARLSDVIGNKTTNCGCGVATSAEEIRLASEIEKFVPIVRQLNLNGWKYDIAIPSAKLIVEYNGAYWHSAKFIHAKTHLIKRRNAEDEGWTVIYIWSDRYATDPERYLDLVKRKCGMAVTRTIGARSLNLVAIDYAEAASFHTAHHVQTERPNGKINVGLFAGEELVGAATVASTKEGWNLSRFTIKRGIRVIGGLGKVISFVNSHRGVKTWITFCDRDHFTGDVYKASGFHKVGTTLQLTYLQNGVRHRRERFMRNKLAAIGIPVEEGQSEKDALAAAGIYQCWNSGVDKWIKHFA